MKSRSLGRQGPKVSALGLGCMGMSALYGPADEKESLATLQAALEAGISLLDTGDFYGMGATTNRWCGRQFKADATRPSSASSSARYARPMDASWEWTAVPPR
jgi:aryl-alcohol dehydrogenase-like predicted oxidoreductase